MKKYTKPAVVKVPLNPEQAVLGTCKVGVTSLMQNLTIGCSIDCKRRKDTKQETDYAATS